MFWRFGHPAHNRPAIVRAADGSGEFDGWPTSGPERRERFALLHRIFSEYKGLCEAYGFDSFKAAQFLAEHKDDKPFQYLARGLNRALLRETARDFKGPGRSDGHSR
jgi:hypothetical protein